MRPKIRSAQVEKEYAENMVMIARKDNPDLRRTNADSVKTTRNMPRTTT